MTTVAMSEKFKRLNQKVKAEMAKKQRTKKEFYCDYSDIDGFFVLYNHKPERNPAGYSFGPFNSAKEAKQYVLKIIKDQIVEMRGRLGEVRRSKPLTKQQAAKAFAEKD